jgi:hypothetical protein
MELRLDSSGKFKSLVIGLEASDRDPAFDANACCVALDDTVGGGATEAATTLLRQILGSG